MNGKQAKKLRQVAMNRFLNYGIEEAATNNSYTKTSYKGAMQGYTLRWNEFSYKHIYKKIKQSFNKLNHLKKAKLIRI